jgi:DNA ligase (NAD+)
MISLTETELVKMIEHHDKLYWEEFTPQISDIDYDNLVKQLRLINPDNPILSKLHQSVRGKHKIPFKEPLLSLNKAYSIDELLKWCEKVGRSENEMFIIQPKYDGVSVDFNGKILVTTSDSYYGIDISDRIKYIKDISNIPIRGEIVITKTDFNDHVIGKLKKSNGEDFKNTRNAAAGLLNRDDPIPDPKVLTLVPFNKMGFDITLKQLLTDQTKIKQAEEYVKFKLDYPVDGLVIKLKDEEYSKSLGVTSHHPKGQIAFKFETINVKSILQNVTWQVGKNVITPVGNIKPIEILNATIKNVNLHNAKYILDKDLQINDIVYIQRSGEIIPDLVDNEPGENRKPIIINECPECGEELEYNEPHLMCTNKNCAGKLSRKLLDCIKRLGIETLGLSTIEKIIEIFEIDSIIDIFELSVDDIKHLDGFADVSAVKLFNEIQKIKLKPIEDYKILSSLNIKGIGNSLSKSLLKKVSLNQLLQMQPEDLEQFEQIGETRAFEIFLGLEEYSEIINYMCNNFNVVRTSSEQKPTICFTGKMQEQRSYYELLAEQHGFNISNRVTNDLSLLVTVDMNSTKSKMKTAKQLNIKIIDINTFMNDLDGT